MKRHYTGFTLIETILYLALFSLLASGSVAAASTFLEIARRIHNEALLQREAQYLDQAIALRIQNATRIHEPRLGTSSSIIAIDDHSISLSSGQLIGEHGHILSSEVIVTGFEASRFKEPGGSECVEFVLALRTGTGPAERSIEIRRRVYLYHAL